MPTQPKTNDTKLLEKVLSKALTNNQIVAKYALKDTEGCPDCIEGEFTCDKHYDEWCNSMLNEARASERATLKEPFTDNQLIIASVHECSGSLSELEKNAILENKGQSCAWHIRELMEIALWYGKAQGKISQKAEDLKTLERVLSEDNPYSLNSLNGETWNEGVQHAIAKLKE